MAKIIQMKDSEGLIYPISNVYSTDEKVIGTWMGKNLYGKTIVFPNGTGTTEYAYYLLSDFGVSNVDEIFIGHPTFYTYNENRYPFPYNDGNAFEVIVNPTGIIVKLGYLDISKCRFIVTLEYTKTTD